MVAAPLHRHGAVHLEESILIGRLVALLTLLTATLTTGCIEGPMLTPRAPTPGVPYVTVTSYNVNLDRYDDPATVAAVGASDADIIALQEVNGPWRTVLRATYHDRYPFMAFEGEASGGLAVLSKHPFEDLGVLPGFEGWHPAWHVVIDSPLGPLQLLQVHLRPPYSRREGVTSLVEVDAVHLSEIRGFSATCADDIPTVVLGDFNESTDGAAVTFLEDQGYLNALPAFRPGEETWRYEKSLYGQTVDTLDHVLFETNTLDPLNAYVQYIGNSDHFPVTVLLEAHPIDAP